MRRWGGTLLYPPALLQVVGAGGGVWLSPTGAVPAQELAQKLEKQERATLKLQKQLRVYAKQIQELTGKCPWGGGGGREVGLAGGAPAWFEAGALPSLNVGSRVPPTPQPDAGKHRLGLS